MNTWPLKPDDYERTAIRALTCQDYGVVAVYEDIVVLRRGADFWEGLTLLGVPLYRLTAQQEKAFLQNLEDLVKTRWEQLREESAWKGPEDEHFGRAP